MSDSQDAWGFAPPPFNADQALQRLKRDLRELGLAEREGVFEKRGLAVARLQLQDNTLQAAVVDKPQRTGPRWQTQTLRDGAAVRDFTAALKRKLAQWSDSDD
ncbi:MAG: hypothetical protein RI949_770 [Pseudomonadota bacterium]